MGNSEKIQNKCRILYVVGQLRAGGLERQLFYLLQGLERSRYFPIVVVWNFKEDDPYVKKIRDLGVEVMALPMGGAIRKLVAFRNIVKDLYPEVIHSYSFYTNFPAFWGALCTHAVGVGALRSDFTNEVKMAGLLLGRLCARWPDVHISNNVMAAEKVKRTQGIFLPKKIWVVRNGLNLKNFNNSGFPNLQRINVLAVGSLIPVKRWDRLLLAAAELKKRGHKFLLRFVGDGPLRSSLAGQSYSLGLSDCVEFLGYREEIPDLLASSHFLTHTSDREGCPNVIMEAMASARAVVATNAGDIPWLVEQGQTGFVVEREDTDDLIRRMEILFKDIDLCRQMGQSGRIKAEKKFGLDRFLIETMAVYRAAGWKEN